MRTGRWRVRKFGAGSFPWEVDEWDTELGDWSNRDVCETLPKAHTYAMQQSRTVEVELPEAESAITLSDIQPKISIHRDGAFYANNEPIMALHTSELKPAGEYLMSLHHHYARSKP